MKRDYTIWKIFGGYLLILLFMILSSSANGQSYECDEDICVVEFNASWNAGNNVDWLPNLKDFSIVVTPTIIIFVEGKETKRYQANIMMEMEAKQTEVQDKIDEIIMELF